MVLASDYGVEIHCPVQMVTKSQLIQGAHVAWECQPRLQRVCPGHWWNHLKTSIAGIAFRSKSILAVMSTQLPRSAISNTQKRHIASYRTSFQAIVDWRFHGQLLIVFPESGHPASIGAPGAIRRSWITRPSERSTCTNGSVRCATAICPWLALMESCLWGSSQVLHELLKSAQPIEAVNGGWRGQLEVDDSVYIWYYTDSHRISARCVLERTQTWPTCWGVGNVAIGEGLHCS